MRFAPGGGRVARSLFFLLTFFTFQAQAVLWLKSRRLAGFHALKRGRARLESLVMLCFWIGLGVALGGHDALFVILLPMLFGNFVVMSYISTNHMVSPLSTDPRTLKTTLGVTSPPLVDVAHLWFSHHVEHHLFPSLPSDRYPKVRAVLRRRFGDAYLTPPHWRALLTLVRTGRVYDGPDALIDPQTGDRVTMASVQCRAPRPRSRWGSPPYPRPGRGLRPAEDVGALLAVPED